MIQQSHSWTYIWRKLILKDTCTSVFITTLCTVTKTWKQPKCPLTDEWIKKMCFISIYSKDYYSVLRKNEVMSLQPHGWHLEMIILSQMSERERQIQYDIPSTWNLKYDSNGLIYKTKTDSQT